MRVLGLMSGTSADGVDVAICEIAGIPGAMSVDLIAGATYPYNLELRERVLACCNAEVSRVDQVAALHADLAEVFAQAARETMESAGLACADIDLIGSHGQTLWHNVLPSGRVSVSLQVVEAAILAERTAVTAISNFRARDIAAGGQGAPLTSYVDWLLLRHPTHWRAVQNIGGMGNVTFLPPLDDARSPPVAFDTGPGNALLDIAVHELTGGAQTFDRDGEIAGRGRVDEEWLASLLEHAYYSRDYPKSTGREEFGSAAALKLVADARARGLSVPEIIATLTALTATNIAEAYRRFAPAPIHEVIIGGGGGRNPAMIGLLRELLAPATLLTHEDVGLDSDYKEAMVFAVLAHETWHARPAALPALTGASHATVLGSITPGANYLDLLRRTLLA